MPEDSGITAVQLGNLWMSFVTNKLEGVLGLNRQDVKDALLNLDDSGELQSIRDKHRQETDLLIDRIFDCSHEQLLALGKEADPMTLALVLDRVYAGVETIGALAKQQTPLPKPPQGFDDFFRILMKQKFHS
ncbi:hypothetical protein [Desulfatibacillum aliphaticivorans]|uniref:hypothetical protein n=1 Tax=Desulfatibacillum aliphaticivorans TaxID=218208 RepID=UPI000486D240|nr:hypothetical protein [Desulfatibacillum aliphaticivorans]